MISRLLRKILLLRSFIKGIYHYNSFIHLIRATFSVDWNLYSLCFHSMILGQELFMTSGILQ